MVTAKSENRHIIWFLLLTFLLSWTLMGYIIHLGGLRKAGFLIVLTMWIPAIVSLSYRKLAGIGFGDVGWRVGAKGYWLLAFFVPLLVAALAYSISWGTGVSTPKLPSDFLGRICDFRYADDFGCFVHGHDHLCGSICWLAKATVGISVDRDDLSCGP